MKTLPKHKKHWGIALICSPLIALVIGLIDYLIVRLAQYNGYSNSTLDSLSRGLFIVTPFFVILGATIGLGIGIYFLLRKDELDYDDGKKHESGLSNYQYNQIHRVSGVAFFAPTIFAFSNKLYGYAIVSLITSFLPILKLIPSLMLCNHGRKLAWEKQTQSFEGYNKFQSKLRYLAIIEVLLQIGLIVVAVI